MKTRPPSSRRPPKKEFGSPRQVAVLVGLHPCLWDPQHPNYKITTAQDAAWDAISKRLNNTLSAEECKEQWFCIRRMKTNYNNEQVKKSGSGRRKVRGFTYAKETTFIDGILKKRELQEGNLGTSKGLALDLSDNEDDEAGDEDEFDLEEEDVDDDDDDEVDDDEEEEEEDDDVKQSAMDYSAEMAELTRLKREQQHLKITMNSPSKPVLSEINDNSLKSLKEIPEVKTVNPLGKGRKGTENAKAGKKKVVLVTSKKAFSKRSQGLEDEDLFSDYENIGPKKKTKLQLKQEKQEQREKKREKDRLIIAKKIQEQCDEYIPDRKQTSHFDMKPSTDGMVMHSFMPQQEEDSMNLVCLALASRLRKLPNREANKITIHFMQTVNDAEDKLELEPISKPTVSDAEDKIELEPIRKPNQNFEKVFQYPKVDKDMEVTINLGFQVDDDDIVCQYSCYIIRGQDFVTLKNGSWVNDQIIDMYLRMLSDYAQSKQVRSYTCHFISSLLAHGTNGLKENNRTEIPIESYDYLLIPRCIDHHWYLIVVDVKMKSITCYDSLGKKHFGTLELIKIYLSELSNGEWSTEHAENIPMQNNGSDCGIFLCLYAKCLSLDKEFEFSQAGIPQLRKIVAYEVMTTTVLV